jgi:hypothetical protein
MEKKSSVRCFFPQKIEYNNCSFNGLHAILDNFQETVYLTGLIAVI